MDTFNFCPNSLVPETVPPEAPTVLSMNGWTFTSRPNVPYVKTFRINLYGLEWYIDPATGLYDSTTDPTHNARALELFYQTHELWAPFNWTHPHLGPMVVRFKSPVEIPAGQATGVIEKPVEIMLIHHNPGY